MIRDFISFRNATLLCTGPMSKVCIDATVEISQTYDIPQVLIASRRQIDAEAFGGGYVENFSTEAFAQYVREKKAKKVFLARDHGGPWQSVYEQVKNLSVDQAMLSAKKSFEADILSGFDLIHIDPSLPIQQEDLTDEKVLSRLIELYGHLDDFAKRHGKTIDFELGTEEQDGFGQNLEKLEWFLEKTRQFCQKFKLTQPLFVVAQTGTKVMETQNVGLFKTQLGQDQQLPLGPIKEALALCKRYNLLLKEHNTDYLSDEALALRPTLGIHASNVAPEFGVAETRGLLYLMDTFGYKEDFDLFVQTALESKKWSKWMLPNSQATDIDRAVICGHYIFGNPEIKALRDRLQLKLNAHGLVLDTYLKRLVKQSMMRYVRLFNMI